MEAETPIQSGALGVGVALLDCLLATKTTGAFASKRKAKKKEKIVATASSSILYWHFYYTKVIVTLSEFFIFLAKIAIQK